MTGRDSINRSMNLCLGFRCIYFLSKWYSLVWPPQLARDSRHCPLLTRPLDTTAFFTFIEHASTNHLEARFLVAVLIIILLNFRIFKLFLSLYCRSFNPEGNSLRGILGFRGIRTTDWQNQTMGILIFSGFS